MTDDVTRNSRLDGRAFASAVLLEKIVRDAYEKRRSSEVQPLQWSIMRYLSLASEDRCTIVWISGFLGVTHAPVVRAIKTLLRRNYVVQKVNPADARSKIVTLSREGWLQLNADPLLAIAERIEKLTEDERRVLNTAVKQLIPKNDTGKGKNDVLHLAR
ncbi:MAG: MarR family winged helix-turn-helix transcriptional regulator [Paracoccus sp. (in: a-proteobacteria)]